MKPILLEMEAFESYLEKTTIDFETLNQKGVFLISGNTGAGKTTIFDAISYALFGKLSTDQREKASQVKTIGADNHRCKVVFVFEEKGQRYQITRTPQQRIKGKKKEYIMEQAISELVFLSDPSIAPLTKAGEVNDKITSIIGLNQSQFFQTTLIAQGAFSKIITATTNDRQQILRSLFHTDIYNDFVSAVLEKKKKISDASASLKQTIDRYYLGVSLSEEDKEKSKEIFDLNDRINFLNLCKDAYSIKRQEFNENIILFDNRLNDLTAEKTKLDAYLSDKASLEKLEEDIQGKAEEKNRAQKQREILVNQKNEIDAKEEERQELKLKLPSYEKRDSLRSSLSKVQKELKKYQNDILKPTKDRDDYQAKIKDAQAEIQKIESISDQSEEYYGKLSVLNQKKSTLSSTSSDLSDFSKKLVVFQNNVENCIELQKTYLEKYQSFQEIDRKYYESMSGIIAKEKLKEGEPCPVCGSLSHPHIHQMTDDEVTKEEYDSSKKASEDARVTLEKANEVRDEKEKQLFELKESIIASLESFSLVIEEEKFQEFYTQASSLLEMKTKEVDDSLFEVNNKINEIKNAKRKKETLKENLSQWETSMNQAIEKVEELEQKQNEATTNEASLQGQLSSIVEDLKFDSAESANERIADLQGEIDSYHDAVKNADDTIASLDLTISEYSGRILTLQEKVNSYHGRGKEEIEEEVNDATEKKKEAKAEFDALNAKISNISSAVLNLTSLEKENQTICQKYDRISTLYYFLSANADKDTENRTGVARGVNLETFVLSFYLDEILKRASARLRTMSQGHYILKRREVAQRGQYGLDIDVVDEITGFSRDAKSLSGGETFMASLCLALGVSDYVREVAGGVRIETLFIDEGFGSLDKASLDEVVNTISSLSADGNITIGVISHIEELFDRFPVIIQVDKDKEGHSSCTVTELY